MPADHDIRAGGTSAAGRDRSLAYEPRLSDPRPRRRRGRLRALTLVDRAKKAARNARRGRNPKEAGRG